MKGIVLLLALSLSAAAGAEQAQMLASLGSRSLPSAISTTDSVEDVLGRLSQRQQRYPQDYEAWLLRALVYFDAGETERGLRELDALLKQVPDFHLAHLVRGDMLLARVAPLRAFGDNRLLKCLTPAQRARLDALRFEARMRVAGLRASEALQDPRQQRLPRQILKLGESVRHALLVEKSTHRLYIYRRRDGQPPELVRDYYVSTGKKEGDKVARGDLRTPEGVYFITSWIPQEKLPDKYGVGAFPLNYPNELDRRLGKTGYGIWLHGTESRYYSRPPLDSEGCMVLTNIDFSSLKDELRPGSTPVVIVDKVDWLTREQWLAERARVLADLESWRRDWESLDVDRYLSHYSDDFWSKGHDLRSWSQRKRRIARSKSFQKIRLSDISLLAYPEGGSRGKDIVVARFQQDYESSNYRSDMKKRLYLQRDANRWKIMYEGR